MFTAILSLTLFLITSFTCTLPHKNEWLQRQRSSLDSSVKLPMECPSDQTATVLQEYDQFNANSRKQVVVILKFADIETNSRTGGALYWRKLQVGFVSVFMDAVPSEWSPIVPSECTPTMAYVP